MHIFENLPATLVLAFGAAVAPALNAAEATDRAAWLRECRWGVMVHYLPEWIEPEREWTSEAWNQAVDAFDAERLAEQLREVGAGYCLFSIGQNSGYYAAPNPTYARLVGREPSRFSRRDLIADLAAALDRRGLRLMVYLTSGPPSRDPEAMRGLAWEGPDHPNRAFQRQWESVIREWSMRWGDRVTGWWFDGNRAKADIMYRGSEPPNFASFAAAARAGNPAALVAFSPGQAYPAYSMSPYDDYTAGLIYDFERDYADPKQIREGKIGDVQLHILSFLGATWGRGDPRFSSGLVERYTRDVTRLGGAVTWDVPVDRKGMITAPFVERLRGAQQGVSRVE